MANAATQTPPAADDFVPAPEGQSTAAQNDMNAALEIPAELPALPEAARVGQTELILSAVAVLVAAGLLMFLKNAIRRTLISSRASIDRANAAAWVWYVVLLLLIILVIAGVVGDLFSSIPYIVLSAAMLIVGVVIAAKMTSSARRSV